jgi:predicted amidohydrolase YtcJ
MIGLILLVAALPSMNAPAPHPGFGPDSSLAVLNARIWTGDPVNPWATALVSTGARVTYVGSTEGAKRYLGDDTRVIDGRGRLVTPGFIDAHVHFTRAGSDLSSIQLRGAATRQEFISRIRVFAETLPAGSWITRGSWDHTNWGGELPDRAWIDSVTADHPVWINRLDGHMALANSAALHAAGIDASQPDVPGGEIVRDSSGRLTGILKDNAMDLVALFVPEPPEGRKLEFVEAASRFVAGHGVTSVHDVDGWSSLELYRTARKAGRLRTRIYACAPLSQREALASHIAESGRGDEWIRTGCVKGYVDGSLGSHTAAFFEPFLDEPDDRGLLVDSEDNLRRDIRAADALGLQLAIHAIGDRANSILLNIFESIVIDRGVEDRRFRVEHTQHLVPADIRRFGELGVLPSMQPYHAIDDGRWAERVIGPERAETSYAFRSLIDTGARLVFGSDWYVAPPTPLEGIYAAVTRRTLDGKHPGGWVPEQKISVEEGLLAYTVNAAFASFEEDIKGSLEVGKLADFILIDRDITAIDPVEIRKARIDMTVVGGRVVFERQ